MVCIAYRSQYFEDIVRCIVLLALYMKPYTFMKSEAPDQQSTSKLWGNTIKLYDKSNKELRHPNVKALFALTRFLLQMLVC